MVSADYLFQTNSHVVLIMPFVEGGELLIIQSMLKVFPEQTIKFYCAQIVLALTELHSKRIVYRNVNVESILVDRDGYIKLIHFSYATVLGRACEQESIENEYSAPEMI